jgi:hypothetical protein
MKKRFLLLPLIGAFVYVTMSSDSNGPGGNKTGSRGATAGCGSCHGNSATSGITVSFELDSAGVPVTRYKPGMTYTLKMTGTNTTSNTLPMYGTQLSVVSGSGSSSVNQGHFSSLPTNTDTFHTSSPFVNILEHRAKLSPASGTGASGTTYVVSVGWTAPAAGTGTVTAYGVINAVNDNNNDGTSDKWNAGSASFTELPSNVGVNNVAASAINVYPNPVSSILNVTGVNGSVQVFDVNGKLISSVSVNNTVAIDASGWANGLYFVSINNAGQVTNKTIVKQ